jgi:hypothetical protein
MDDNIPINFNHNALGLFLDPVFLYEHDGVEEVSDQSSHFLLRVITSFIRLHALHQRRDCGLLTFQRSRSSKATMALR